MKLDPGFPNHWKTERLIDELGADGVVAVLRLWGNAQIKREFSGLRLTPHRLAMETKWKGDENHLFSVLTDPDAPWLDDDGDGTFSIHGFSEHQFQIVQLWENGKKGGRPKKTKPSSSSSSSSSYPICEPNGNQMVSCDKIMRLPKPTIDEVDQYGKTLTPPFDRALQFCAHYESNGWKVGRNAMKDWRAAVRTWHMGDRQSNGNHAKPKNSAKTGIVENLEFPEL